MAILVPCLVTLREEFNDLAPDRDTSTDGWIGDTSHQGSSSDHNPDESGNTPYEDSDNIDEVHAIDVDKDLNLSGWSMQKCVDIIVGRHKAGDDNRLQNIIYNRKIWSRSWGWTADDYSGSNPHDQHAHFSARYETQYESDTSGWGLLEDDVSKSDFMAWMTEWAKSSSGKEALYKAVMTRDTVQRYNPDGSPVPENPNDPGAHTMTPESALGYTGRDVATIKSGAAPGIKNIQNAVDDLGN